MFKMIDLIKIDHYLKKFTSNQDLCQYQKDNYRIFAFNLKVDMNVINMRTGDHKSCTLHGTSFQYFCERCLQPVCKQCTIIGPHNTQLHSISSISTAYERRLNQVRSRITNFLETKEGLIQQIRTYGQQIDELKQTQQLGLAQNQRHRARILTDLQRSFERISSQIVLTKQQFQNQITNLNDLGHEFQTLKDSVEILGSHSSIMQALKECCDRLTLQLEQKHEYGQLPKQLTSLRSDLKNIEVYHYLINQKKTILFQISNRLKQEILAIEKPTISYETLLQQLSTNIDRCIEHYVCHYCGVIFNIQRANAPCKSNNSSLDINQFQGFCIKKPDSVKWATHRHYFGPPADLLSYFSSKQENSFKIHLQALLLKLKTICVIKSVDLSECFQEADRKKSGTCDRISMLYTLIEICGLTQGESDILLTVCQQPVKNVYAYANLLERISQIKI